MLLAIDSSTAQLGLALYDGVEILGESTWQSPMHHTQQLAPAVAEMLERMELKPEAIKALGVATGPGSFTSLRVGMAFAKGLALACRIPVVGVPSLDVVAAGVSPAERRLAAVLRAGRGRLAVGWYRSTPEGWVAEGQAVSLTAAELEEKIHKPVIICGELNAADRQTLGRRYKNVQLASPAQCVRRPGLLAEIAFQRWQAGQVDAAASLAPIYLHVAGGPPA